MAHDEISAIGERYARRVNNDIYSMLRSEVNLDHQERFSAIAKLLRTRCPKAPEEISLVDLGCGNGGNLLDFIRLGLEPKNLIGLELLEHRVERAMALLPSSVEIIAGDASVAPIADASQDIVFQSVVFSSLLSDDFQHQVANSMWRWLRPGGAVLWYDFIYDNPRNADVRGVPLTRVRQLFPEGQIFAQRITLAPPIARRIAGFGEMFHRFLNLTPLLRTHIIAWIEK